MAGWVPLTPLEVSGLVSGLPAGLEGCGIACGVPISSLQSSLEGVRVEIKGVWLSAVLRVGWISSRGNINRLCVNYPPLQLGVFAFLRFYSTHHRDEKCANYVTLCR